MINKLFGIIVRKEEQKVYLRSGSIEWEILTTGTSSAKFPREKEEASVYTYVYHREDQLSIYGFATSDERSLFLELIKISGIGPRQACKILSGISDSLFIKALDEEDIGVLTNLPGLGKKTAQKIILSLRGKLSASEDSSEPFGDIVESLYTMGFDRIEVKRVVRELTAGHTAEEYERNDFEQKLMKEAIVELSK